MITHVAVLFLALAAQTALPQPGQAAMPWEGAPFASDPLQVRRAAEALPPPAGAGSEILLDEAFYDVAPDRSIRISAHLVARLFSDKDVKRWERTTASWTPWFEDRPLLRARVIGSDGASRPLEIADIQESTTTTEKKILEAKLPSVSAGSVIETTVERSLPFSLLPSGRVRRFNFGSDVPVRRTRLTIRFPRSLELKWAIHLPAAVRSNSTEGNGIVTRLWEAGDLAPVPEGESGAPADSAPSDYVEFSTANSWESVADEYGELLNGQIRDAHVGALLEEAGAGKAGARGEDRTARIAGLIAVLHRRVPTDSKSPAYLKRIPGRPDDVLRRRIGDGNDKAALLISLLRAAGFRAHAALITWRSSAEVNPGLPGRESFYDVLVYVEGTPPLWIDPSEEFVRVGDVAWFKTGRFALVAGGPRTLLRTPTLTPRENRTIFRWSVFFTRSFIKRAVIEYGGRGVSEQVVRSQFAKGHPWIMDEIRQQASQILGPNVLSSAWNVDPHDLGQPFSFRAEFLPSKDQSMGSLKGKVATTWVEVQRGAMTAQLSKTLQFRLTARPAEKRRDILRDLPSLEEEVWRFIPGSDSKLETLPACLARVDLGIGSYSEFCEPELDGVFRLTRRAELYEGMPPSAVEVVRRALPGLAHLEPIRVVHAHQQPP